MTKGGLAAAVAAVAVAGGALAYTALAGDGPAGGRVLSVHERASAVNFVTVPNGPVGDQYVFSADIVDDAGQVIGSDGGTCTTTNPDGDVTCNIGMRLPGGELTFGGLANGPDNVFVITGGSGRYVNARGTAHAVDHPDGAGSDVTITFNG